MRNLVFSFLLICSSALGSVALAENKSDQEFVRCTGTFSKGEVGETIVLSLFGPDDARLLNKVTGSTLFRRYDDSGVETERAMLFYDVEMILENYAEVLTLDLSLGSDGSKVKGRFVFEINGIPSSGDNGKGYIIVNTADKDNEEKGRTYDLKCR